LSIKSQLHCAALKAAAVSVVKNGNHVHQAANTILPSLRSLSISSTLNNLASSQT